MHSGISVNMKPCTTKCECIVISVTSFQRKIVGHTPQWHAEYMSPWPCMKGIAVNIQLCQLPCWWG